MYASADILIFGHDEMLLETRRLILKKAAFRVRIAMEALAAVQILVTQPIDLFVLCQTLPPEECVATLRTAHTLGPDMKNLILGMDTFGPSADRRDTFLTSFLDPKGLIALIQNKINIEAVTSCPQ